MFSSVSVAGLSAFQIKRCFTLTFIFLLRSYSD